jgi:hypothetical protein
VFISGPRQNVTGIGTTTSTQTADLARLAELDLHPWPHVPQGCVHVRDRALPLMAASEKCVRRTYDGLSIRVWQDSDIRNDELLTRIDILYGFAAIRPEWACVIVGSRSNN